MKTSWTAYSVDTRTPSIPVHADDSVGGPHAESDIALLVRLGRRIASLAPMDEILSEAVQFVADAVKCDSCAAYVAEGEELVLRAWSNPHPETAQRVRVKSALGITGWAAGDRDSVTLGFLAGATVERARLESENAHLLDRLETRKVVERAKGILQRDMQLSEEDAYLTLQRESRQRRKSMREVAEAIVLSEDLKKKR